MFVFTLNMEFLWALWEKLPFPIQNFIPAYVLVIIFSVLALTADSTGFLSSRFLTQLTAIIKIHSCLTGLHFISIFPFFSMNRFVSRTGSECVLSLPF